MSLNLHWRRAGVGQPLVLLHGLGTTHDDFVPLRDRLEEEYDVLAADLPGIGRSAPMKGRPTIAAITAAIEADLDAMGLGKVHVLGNSLGARIALELASRGRAQSVVAIAPSGLNVPPERIYQGGAMTLSRFLLGRNKRMVTAAARSRGGRVALFAGLRTTPWRTSETEALALQAGFGGVDFWRLLWWSIMLDVPMALHKIDVPVILAQGTADLIANGQTARYLLPVPGARFVPLIAAGHAPQSDAPGAIIQLVHQAVAASTASTRAPTP